MRARAGALALVLALVLVGCGQQLPAFAPDVLAAQVEQSVEDGTSELVLDYDGRVDTEDINAALEIAYQSSGSTAYLLKSATQTVSRRLWHTEVTLDFAYRTDLPVAWEDMLTLNTDADLVRELAARLATGAASAGVRTNNAGWDENALLDLCQQAEQNAGRAWQSSQLECRLYPKQGEDRVAVLALHSPVDAATAAARQAELDAALDTLAAQLHSMNLPDAREQYRMAYGLVMDACTYDLDVYNATQNEENSAELCVQRTAWGALVGGSTICSGYAEAYKLVCDKLGLDCWVISGTAQGARHAWDAVRLEGETLYVDCTFGDTSGRPSQYFLMTADELAAEGYQPDGVALWEME